jgi:signal-transduction protein with cAMP-binding, CBS, and nucleotidyltransferase domain
VKGEVKGAKGGVPLVCPDCGHANLAGAADCEECRQPLAPAAGTRPSAALRHTLLETTIGELQPALALTVAPGDPVLEVIKKMRDRKVGSALVVEEDRLVGVFTERHIVTRLTGRKPQEVDGMAVSAVMSRQPKSLREDDTLAFVVHRMAIDNVRHVPIEHPGRPLRFISVRRVLQFLDERARLAAGE